MNTVHLRQLFFLIILVLAFLLVVGALIYTSSASAAAYEEAGLEGKKDIIHYTDENVIIFHAEQIFADVFILEGAISISGEIYGDVVAVESNVMLKKSAAVFGNIICYRGNVKKEEGARLAGDVIRIDDEDVSTVKYRDMPEHSFPYHIFSDENEVHVESYETINGDVILFEGEMLSHGKIDGDIIALKSEIRMSESAAVDGHIISYDGEAEISDESLITGKIFMSESEEEDYIEEVEMAEDEDIEIQRSIEKKYLHGHSNIVRFFGDASVDADEIIEGEVVVMKGNASISGEIDGDVVAIFGDIEMDSTAYVSGNVVSVGGKIYRAPGAYVGGDVIRTTWTGAKVYNEYDDEWEEYEKDRETYYNESQNVDRWTEEENELDDFLFRYNRVEGLLLGVIAPRDGSRRMERNHVQIYGHAGYGLKSKKVRYRAGIERWIFHDFRFTIGGEIHDLTDTQDSWIMSPFENSLAAITLREDFHDFYRRVGASGYAMQNISQYLRAEVGYRKDRFYNMDNKTNSSVFGGDKKFRKNPLIDPVEMRSLYLNIGLDTRNHMKNPQQGWYVNLGAEFAGPDLNNEEVDFDRFIFDFKRYQPIGYGENLDFRMRVGSSRGDLPLQYLYDLGGISTLRGYKYKEFENGDRMILANLEYRVYGSRLDFIGIDDLNFAFFGDAGLVWNAEDNSSPENSFEDLTWRGLKKSYGFALTNYDGNVRLSFAQRMDDDSKPVVITFRIRRPF